MSRTRRRAAAVATGVLLALAPAFAAVEAPPDGGYTRHCAACHGPTGLGDGPNADAFVPTPRNLRSGFLDRYDDDALVARIRSGAPLDLRLDPEALRERLRDTDALVTHLRRLPRVDWPLVDHGAMIYLVRCTACHEPAGRPAPALPDVVGHPQDLADPAFQHGISDRDLAAAVRHGRRGMPAIPGPWRADDLRAVTAFVRVLSPGFELYGTFCESCHGIDGLGSTRIGQRGTPGVRFDRRYFERHDDAAVRARVRHMLDAQRPVMPHFRTVLSPQDVRGIIRHLRALR